MNHVPNFDFMEQDELIAFWFKHKEGRKSKDLFPEGGKGTVKATADLANYASNRATAMACRLRGMIDNAKMYEDICDRIYVNLPKFAVF